MVGGPHVFLLVFLIHPCCYSLTRAQPPFWINEVYNSFSNFSDVFVEIFYGGRGKILLLNVSLDLEKENNKSLTISLDNMTTNEEGFLVLSIDNSDEPTKNFLKNIQNETVILKLSISKQSNNSQVIDVFNKKKGWSDLISCFRDKVAVDAIVLVGNEPSKGKANDCPLSPVRLDLLICRSPFNFIVQLISHSIDHFSLEKHTIFFMENNTLNMKVPLTNYTTQNGKVNISFAINQTFNVMSTYSINLKWNPNPSLPIPLDSLYFGAPAVPGIPLNETVKTYPDTNPAQMVSPVYLELVPSNSSNFASCNCEVSSSTYYPFVKVKSSIFRAENCHKECNKLISMSPTTLMTTYSFAKTPSPTNTNTATPSADIAKKHEISTAKITTTVKITYKLVPSSTANSTLAPSSTANSTLAPSSTANSTLAPSSTADSTLVSSSTADSTLVSSSTADSTQASSSTADWTQASSSPADSTRVPSSTANSTLAPSSTANSTLAPSSTANSTLAPSSTANSTLAPSSTANSTRAPSSTYELVTSTATMSTQVSTLSLYINEAKVGKHPDLDHWIELKGNESIRIVNSYTLVHNVAGRTNNSKFFLSNLTTTNKEELFFINFNTPGAGSLLKDLDSNAGVLQLFKRNVMTDCLAYQMEGTILETKLGKLCPLHKVKQITRREISNNWTISRCKNKFEVLESSANQTNKCPSQKFRKPIYMKILKQQLSKNFQANFLASLVKRLSADEGCMLSTAFFLGFSANESGANINIKAFLTTPDQTKLNALFMCYKTLFHIKPVALKIGTKTVNVYRCYNDSYILPTIKAAEASTGSKRALAIVIPLMVLIVGIVVGLVVYMRYKRKSLLGVLGMARYDADQDDLLVNMEDVGQVDTNFQNPTYSQLSVY